MAPSTALVVAESTGYRVGPGVLNISKKPGHVIQLCTGWWRQTVETKPIPVIWPETVQLEVTAELIQHGTVGDCLACPLALAAQKLWPDYSIFMECHSAGAHLSLLSKSPNWLVVATYNGEPAAYDFIQAFDTEKPVEPGQFRFTLDSFRLDADTGLLLRR